MRMCADHWAELKSAVEKNKLARFCASSNNEAENRRRLQIREGNTARSYEPLIGAYNAICKNVVRHAGQRFIDAERNGEQLCPLCECKKDAGPLRVIDWISKSVDEQVGIARKLGFIDSPRVTIN